jgi:hypothetical protein
VLHVLSIMGNAALLRASASVFLWRNLPGQSDEQAKESIFVCLLAKVAEASGFPGPITHMLRQWSVLQLFVSADTVRAQLAQFAAVPCSCFALLVQSQNACLVLTRVGGSNAVTVKMFRCSATNAQVVGNAADATGVFPAQAVCVPLDRVTSEAFAAQVRRSFEQISYAFYSNRYGFEL